MKAGTRLGSYEILGVIGAGGMGEVYRARDTKLNRDVAPPASCRNAVVRTSTIDVSFVAGTHEVLTNTTEGVALIDADTGRWRVIRKVEPPLENRVSGDGRTLLVERPSIEEDLWLVDFRK